MAVQAGARVSELLVAALAGTKGLVTMAETAAVVEVAAMRAAEKSERLVYSAAAGHGSWLSSCTRLDNGQTRS